jgi:hypothetical protein
MNENETVPLSARFVLSFVFLTAWASLGAAVFSFLGRNVGGAVLFAVLGAAVLVAGLEGRMLRRLAGRRVPKLNIYVMLTIPALLGLVEIWSMVSSRLPLASLSPAMRSALTTRYAFQMGYSAVLVLLVGYALWQGIALLRTGR